MPNLKPFPKPLLAPSESRTRDQLSDHLVAHASTRAYRIAFDLLRDAAAAEDAVQDSLTSVCRSHASLREGYAAQAWFLRIVTTTCLKQLRRRRLRSTLFGAPNSDYETPSPAPNAEEVLLRSQTSQQRLNQLQCLPTKQRVALILRYGHELPVREISELMNTKASTIKTHLVRGLRRLRQEFGEMEDSK